MTCKTQNFTRNYKIPTTWRASVECVNIGEYVVVAGPEPMLLQAPISDLTQHVSTSQKAPLQEKVTNHYTLNSNVAFPLFLGVQINSKCQPNGYACKQQRNDKVNLQR